MAETINTAKMAEQAAKDLLTPFLWERVGPPKFNWKCEEPKHKKQTHPSDVVFYYDKPYQVARAYLNFDLKSYSKGSISYTALKKSLVSLSKALTCAEKSTEWQKAYLHPGQEADICGVLFVYNHDGGYDGEFSSVLERIKPRSLELPPRSRIFVLGPRDIHWLNNVRHDLALLQVAKKLPDKDHYRFFHPTLARRNNVQRRKARVATLEMLTGPWITVEFGPAGRSKKTGKFIYYKQRGATVDEFLYLIDYLFQFQIRPEEHIEVRLLEMDKLAPVMFQKAKQVYLEQCANSAEIKEQLDKFDLSKMSNVVMSYSDVVLGMKDE